MQLILQEGKQRGQVFFGKVLTGQLARQLVLGRYQLATTIKLPGGWVVGGGGGGIGQIGRWAMLGLVVWCSPGVASFLNLFMWDWDLAVKPCRCWLRHVRFFGALWTFRSFPNDLALHVCGAVLTRRLVIVCAAAAASFKQQIDPGTTQPPGCVSLCVWLSALPKGN